MVQYRKITQYVLTLIVICAGTLLAQESRPFIRIDEATGAKVPKSLLTRVSVDLSKVAFEQALAVISQEGNFQLSYNRGRIPVHQKVSVSMENVHALEALLYVLQKTNTELLLTSEGQLAIVPYQERADDKRTVKGRVFDAETKHPLAYANVSVVGTHIGGTSDGTGHFTVENIPGGTQSLQFSYVGYAVERVQVKANQTENIFVELAPETIKLKEVIVTPGQFSIMGQGPAVRQALTQQDLETIPFGEDIYRATTRLPGVSSSDFSAKFTVRGGENEEILVLMDGVQLYEPFHLKDIEGGALSIIDVAAIEGIDLLTGGFSAEYGDRMSGVFNIKTTRPVAGKKRTSLGLSLMNARALSEGTSDGDNGSWLFSARRGYLDMVMDLMDEKDPPKPVYYDVLGKVDYRFSPNYTFSANLLHAGDRLDFVEDDDDEDKTGYGNSYGWLTLKYTPNPKLYSQTVVSLGRLSHDREGLGFEDDTELVNFEVTDDKTVNMLGLKQDWNFDVSDNWFLKLGVDLKRFDADYDYLSVINDITFLPQGGFTIARDSTKAQLSPSGSTFGAYLSNRLQILPPLTAELGLRFDHNSYTDDDVFSPRVNLAFALGKQTSLRAGWGYFRQSQGIHELRIPDGERQFRAAELAKHWVAGIEHTLRNGLNFRLEGYHKELSDLGPDYRNLTNTIEIFPEVQDDRFQLNLDGATSKGIEAYVKYDRGGKLTWWASYALAYTDDDVSSIIFKGDEFAIGREFPGRFDQRHSFYLDVNYRPNRKWHINTSWRYRTGWPLTETIIQSRQLPNGSTQYFGVFDFHSARYPAYHRMDVALNRHFDTRRGRISAFLAITNLYNRANVREIEYSWRWDDVQQRPFLVEEEEHWFKLLPSIGVSWSWDH